MKEKQMQNIIPLVGLSYPGSQGHGQQFLGHLSQFAHRGTHTKYVSCMTQVIGKVSGTVRKPDRWTNQ